MVKLTLKYSHLLIHVLIHVMHLPSRSDTKMAVGCDFDVITNTYSLIQPSKKLVADEGMPIRRKGEAIKGFQCP